MAQSKVNIISNAIALMGHAPIVSLINSDQMVVAAEQAFDMLYPAVLAENNWRFATQIQQLSESVEVPPTPWKTIYLLPAGWLKTIRVYPNIYVWDIYENSKIYAQYQGEFFMEYVFQPDISKLPVHFVKYFVYEIAAYLALSSAERPDYYAQLEAKRISAYAMCAAIEAQNRPQFTQVTFPVLNNRMLGTIIGNTVGS
jgi:hypothetical protein